MGTPVYKKSVSVRWIVASWTNSETFYRMCFGWMDVSCNTHNKLCNILNFFWAKVFTYSSSSVSNVDHEGNEICGDESIRAERACILLELVPSRLHMDKTRQQLSNALLFKTKSPTSKHHQSLNPAESKIHRRFGSCTVYVDLLASVINMVA